MKLVKPEGTNYSLCREMKENKGQDDSTMDKRAEKGIYFIVTIGGWFLNGENLNGIAKVGITAGIMDSGLPKVKNYCLIISFM